MRCSGMCSCQVREIMNVSDAISASRNAGVKRSLHRKSQTTPRLGASGTDLQGVAPRAIKPLEYPSHAAGVWHSMSLTSYSKVQTAAGSLCVLRWNGMMIMLIIQLPAWTMGQPPSCELIRQQLECTVSHVGSQAIYITLEAMDPQLALDIITAHRTHAWIKL